LRQRAAHPAGRPGNHIAALPKREHNTFAWRAAIEALILSPIDPKFRPFTFEHFSKAGVAAGETVARR
jgi:hypothetical protein